jgi:hypothetical protein
MNLLELCCLAVVALWVILRFRREARPARPALALQMLVLAVAAWVAEDSCIRWYGFYGYSGAAWRVFVDRVPLLVLLIWPVVVTSAFDLARALRLPARRWPAALFVLVIADAWFIEPIAVDASLWSWTEAGPFSVPTIGVLGWGCFAAGVGLVAARGWPVVLAVAVGPLTCHVLVVALWWGAFRWLPDVPHPLLAPAAAWLVALGIVVVVERRRPIGTRGLVWLRAPAAVFFFALLWLHGQDADDVPLVVWSLAFSPPWLALLVWSRAPGDAAASAIDGARSSSASSPGVSTEVRA